MLYLLVGLLVGTTVYTTASKRLSGEQLPMPLGVGVAVVLSGSMEPSLSVDDCVVIVKTQDVGVGDVIVYQAGYSLVIHEVIHVDGDTITTKGSANNTADDPISRDAVKGKLLFAIPKLGVVVDIVKNPIVTLILIAAAVLLLNHSFRKEEGEKKTQDEEDLDQIRREIEELTGQLSDQSIDQPSDQLVEEAPEDMVQEIPEISAADPVDEEEPVSSETQDPANL